MNMIINKKTTPFHSRTDFDSRTSFRLFLSIAFLQFLDLRVAQLNNNRKKIVWGETGAS